MKLVKEYIILEKFTKEGDPIFDMGIGIKHQIKTWLEKYNIKKYKINKNLTIDVFEFIDLNNKKLTELPSYIKFNKVRDYFDVSNNDFTTMKGFPQMIYGDEDSYWGNFWCSNNKNLTSLKYFPKIIEGNCFFENNGRQFKEEEILKICKIGKNSGGIPRIYV